MTIKLTAAELAIIMMALEFYAEESPDAKRIDEESWTKLNEKFNDALAI